MAAIEESDLWASALAAVEARERGERHTRSTRRPVAMPGAGLDRLGVIDADGDSRMPTLPVPGPGRDSARFGDSELPEVDDDAIIQLPLSRRAPAAESLVDEGEIIGLPALVERPDPRDLPIPERASHPEIPPPSPGSGWGVEDYPLEADFDEDGIIYPPGD